MVFPGNIIPAANTVPSATNDFLLNAPNPSDKLINNSFNPLPASCPTKFLIIASAPANPVKNAAIPTPAAPIPIPIFLAAKGNTAAKTAPIPFKPFKEPKSPLPPLEEDESLVCNGAIPAVCLSALASLLSSNFCLFKSAKNFPN